MTLHEYAAILRRSWPIIAVSAVVGVLITLAFSLTATKVYQAQSQLFVSVKSADGVGDAYSGGLFVQQRVKSYVDVIDSPAVLDSMGWVLYRQGDLVQAASHLRRALELTRDDEIAAHLGEVLWVKGQRDDAQAVWREALVHKPDSDKIRAVIERLQAGQQ